MISAIIPAAGLSSRMGDRNKLLLPFHGKPLVAHAVDTLLQSRVSEIIVVIGYEAKAVEEALGPRAEAVTVVNNPRYEEGMSTSIRAGIEAGSNEAEAIMIFLADQPLIDSVEVNRLIEAFYAAREQDKSIVVPFHDGQRGNPVILDARFKSDIVEIVGDVGCRRIVKQNPDKVLVVEMDNDHVIRDIDSPEDYARLIARLPAEIP
ncbi:MAG TPA: nucleotidyltransferase family protein [Blastocatellia bacterium]